MRFTFSHLFIYTLLWDWLCQPTRTCSSGFNFFIFIINHFILQFLFKQFGHPSRTWSLWIYLSLPEPEACGFIYLQIFLYISEGLNSSDFCQTRSSDSDCDFRITRSCNNVKACKFEICCTRSVWGQLHVLSYWCQIIPKIRRPVLRYWKWGRGIWTRQIYCHGYYASPSAWGSENPIPNCHRTRSSMARTKRSIW